MSDIPDNPHISADGDVVAKQGTVDPPPTASAESVATNIEALERLKTCLNYTKGMEHVLMKKRNFVMELGKEKIK